MHIHRIIQLSKHNGQFLHKVHLRSLLQSIIFARMIVKYAVQVNLWRLELGKSVHCSPQQIPVLPRSQGEQALEDCDAVVAEDNPFQDLRGCSMRPFMLHVGFVHAEKLGH